VRPVKAQAGEEGDRESEAEQAEPEQLAKA
jgi:hypothetical protein